MKSLPEHRPMIPRTTLLLLGLVAVILVQRSLQPASDVAARPNLLLVTVDTLRADVLGAYGSPEPTSPALDRLSRRSQLYEMPVAPSPWTLPSIASIMTGLEPKTHGAIHFRRPLPQNAPTLAETLRRRGYRTSAAVTHFLLGPEYGFDRGFERFERRLIPEGHDQAHLSITSEQLTAIGIELMRTTEEPFFVWLHYFDPHFHYLLHPPDTDQNTEPGPGGLNRYRGEVRFTDVALGALLGAADGLPRPPTVLFTADHGEQFLEHGGLQHTTAVYQEVVTVPLIVYRGRDAAGRIVPGPRRVVDLHRWILELAGVPVPEEPFEVPVLIHTEQAADLRATVAGRYKLITDLRKKKVRLFDLAADPAEKHDLSAEQPELVQRLCTALNGHFERLAEEGRRLQSTEIELSRERSEQLESLGYLATQEGTAPAKDRLQLCSGLP